MPLLKRPDPGKRDCRPEATGAAIDGMALAKGNETRMMGISIMRGFALFFGSSKQGGLDG